jgi:hypothetical protein
MTEIEVAEKIVKNGNCNYITCDECPAVIPGYECKCGGRFGASKTESQLQWFKDFLKGAKGMNGIDKAEAKKRLDAIEDEARKLREIIEKGDRIEYSDANIYVGIKDGCPYILSGNSSDARPYFRFHSWAAGPVASLIGYTSPKDSGQECIDHHVKAGFDIHVFTDTRKAFEFFLEHYKG